MKLRSLFLSVALWSSGCAGVRVSSVQTASSLRELSWLEGTWVATRQEQRTEERWGRARDGALQGIGMSYREQSLTQHEWMRIVERNGTLVFMAAPEGQTPTEFLLVSRASQQVRFENRAHDFPQWIEYRRESSVLLARVGSFRSDARVLEWRFEQTPGTITPHERNVRVCAETAPPGTVTVRVAPCTCGALVLCAELPTANGRNELSLAVFDQSCDACLPATGRCVAAQAWQRAIANGGCVDTSVEAIAPAPSP